MSVPPIQVLLVEDNSVDAAIVLGRMERFPDMRLHRVESLAGCLAFLSVHKVDAVLLDLNLGDGAGISLIDTVRSAVADAALVILTGTDDEEAGLLSLRHGCQDFLIKGRSDGRLIRQTILHSILRQRLDRARLVAEEKARQGEQLAAMILHTAPEAMLVVDADDIVVRANAHAGQLFAYGIDALIGTSLTNLVPDPPDGAGETTAVRRDGCIFPIYANLSILRFADALYRVVSLQDLSERKTVEAESRLHGEIFKHAQEGVLVTDSSGIILSANPAFCRMSGYDLDELVGSHSNFLKSGRHHDDFYGDMWDSLRRDGHWSGEIWNRRRNGDAFPQWASLSAVRDGDGVIGNYVGVYMDISALKRHEEALRHMAHHDALTGLPNRLLLADRLDVALAKARRTGKMVAVAYVDLDGFKPVNDRLGHHVGDSVLIQAGRRLLDAVDADDTVARLGGDEYVLVLQDLDDVEQCRDCLARLLVGMAEPMTFADGSPPLSVTASIGVALYPHDDGDPDTLLRHADRAMYQAKQDGRNRYGLFDPALDLRGALRRSTMQSVRAGLECGQFVLFYQPKVNMRQGVVVGAEALIRWLHPDKGLLQPSDFLPLIEDDSLDVAIGEWVIRSALVQMATWKQAGAVIPVSVNIAAGHLLSEGFSDRLASILAEFEDVPARMLQLEVVETAALEDIGHAREVLEACRALGVSVALDDFGTGYSSLTYLRHLPIDTLKIDRSFILNLPDDADDLTIVRGVIVLAAGFGRAVLAEGIEKIEHGEMLLELGCELGQGYRIAPPMPAGDFLGWQKAWKADARWLNA